MFPTAFGPSAMCQLPMDSWRLAKICPISEIFPVAEKVHLICQSTHICTKIVIQMLLVNVIQVFLHKITFVSGYGNSIIHVKVNGFKEIQYYILRQLVVSLIRRQRHYCCFLYIPMDIKETQGRLTKKLEFSNWGLDPPT